MSEANQPDNSKNPYPFATLTGAIDAANLFETAPEELRIVTLRMDQALALQDHIDAMYMAIQAMVSAQHAGPITEEMFTSWRNARELLKTRELF